VDIEGGLAKKNDWGVEIVGEIFSASPINFITFTRYNLF
jgi:hypothetical protein